MKTTLPLVGRTALAVVASAILLAAPVFAQAPAPGQSGERGETRGSGGAPAAAPHANSAPSAPSGGDGGGSTGSGGGGGYGVSRGGERTGSSGGGATGSGGSSGGSGYSGGVSRAGGREGTGRAMPRDGGTATGTSTGTGGSNGGVPTYARPRDGREPVGTAAPRGSVPPATGGGGGVYIPGGYYGGYGYYDPWSNGYGYGGGYGGSYGGYYGGYYDPWYGGYPTYPQSTYTSSDEGSLKLRIKPREAEVYVDGYFVGVVDDFDGIFQRLHVESGSHRVEVRATGYEPLAFDVRITPEHTTTYTGELKKIR